MDLASYDRAIKKEIEEYIRKLLLSFGFVFMCNQYHLNIDKKDVHIDMLFYNINMKRLVAVQLETETFKPGHVEQMKFYLSAVDDKLKNKDDSPAMGIIFCKNRGGAITIKHAFQDVIQNDTGEQSTGYENELQ